MGTVRNLPAVFAGNIELSGFPRLRKVTPGGAITTARLRALAREGDGDVEGGDVATGQLDEGLAVHRTDHVVGQL